MESLAVLVIMLVGFGVMTRLLTLRSAIVLIFLGGTLPIWGPFLLKAVVTLPIWALVLGGGMLGIALLQVLVGLVLGRDAASAMAGELAAALVKYTLQLILLPIRAIRALLRRLWQGFDFWEW